MAHIEPCPQHLKCFFSWWIIKISLNVIYFSLRDAQLSAQGFPAINDITCQIVEIYFTWFTFWIFLSKVLSRCCWWTCLKSWNIYQMKNLWQLLWTVREVWGRNLAKQTNKQTNKQKCQLLRNCCIVRSLLYIALEKQLWTSCTIKKWMVGVQ